MSENEARALETTVTVSAIEKRNAARALPLGQVAAVVLVCCTALAGFALRAQNLAGQSLWFDEALSVVFAGKDPSELLALLVTEDIHPPLYPLMLHVWLAVAGTSEFSARFLSLLPGVAIVPLFYVTGKRLASLAGDERSGAFSPHGFVGAVLASSSAFYVGYSQEARNYMLVTFLGLLASYLLLRAWSSSDRRPWVLYAFASCAAVYANYTAFLLLAFHLAFVLMARQKHEAARRRWIIATLSTLVAYLPWLGYAFDQATRINDYWPGTLRLGAAVRSTLGQLLAGGGADTPVLGPVLILVVLLTAVGVLVLAAGATRGRTADHSLFLVLYFILPFVILFAIAYSRPKFDPRYLLVATPGFYLILAWGMAALLGAVRGTLPLFFKVLLPSLGVLALGGVVAVSTVYGEPAKVKADYRSLVSYLDGHAQPGDAVVMLMGAPHPYIYYSSDPMPWYPMERVDDFGGAIIRLNRFAEGHRRLWFILWQKEWEDPADYVMHVMEDQSTEVKLDAKFTGLDLRLFELSPNRPFNPYPAVQQVSEATFGGALEFWGWMSNRTTLVHEEFQTEAIAGEAMRVDAHWIPLKKLPVDFKTTISIVDSDGHEWAREDEVMGNPYYPPTKWKENEIFHDRHTLRIPYGTPPGDYSLRLIVYDPVTLRPLDITTASGVSRGAVLTLGTVKIKAPATLPTVDAVQPISTWQIGPDRLEIVQALTGTEAAVPGEPVEVTVRWRAPEKLSNDYKVRIVLLNSRAATVVEQTVPLAPAYPITGWRPGEEVVSKYWLRLPVDLDQTRYWIGVAPEPAAGGSGATPSLSQAAHVDVITPDARYELPAMQHALGARFGSFAELIGYDLNTTIVHPGDKLVLTLYWRDVARFDRAYKVFNHVIDDTNVFAGQRDAVPVGDSRPTTTWRKGEILADRYEIPISPTAKPGRYSLKVGMYAENGGERLPVLGPNGEKAGDSWTVATVEVAP